MLGKEAEVIKQVRNRRCRNTTLKSKCTRFSAKLAIYAEWSAELPIASKISTRCWIGLVVVDEAVDSKKGDNG